MHLRALITCPSALCLSALCPSALAPPCLSLLGMPDLAGDIVDQCCGAKPGRRQNTAGFF